MLDSIFNKNTDNYKHVGANLPSPGDIFYFIQTVDSCGPVYFANSDTINVDRIQNYVSLIDSVSVDIQTNKVLLGWHNNKAPDFFRYDPLLITSTNYIYLFPGTGIRDTFTIDNSSGTSPSANSLTYDLVTRDSCGNPSQFNINPHNTLFLSSISDTCKNTILFAWNKYSFVKAGIQIGWTCGVRKYYIFRSLNGGGYLLYDSVDGITTSYKDTLILGSLVKYFVRAIKDTTLLVTSTSNLITISSRSRLDPYNTRIVNLSVNPYNNSEITITFKRNKNEDWSNFELFRSPKDSFNYSFIGDLVYTGMPDSFFVFEDKTNVNASIELYYYKVISYNLCGIKSGVSVSSNPVLLTVNPGNDNVLDWNRYTIWANGVAIYRIFRGVQDNLGITNYSQLDSVLFTDSTFIDQTVPFFANSRGVCYYVQAVQNAGADSVRLSNSNSVCIVGNLLVFIPNAFNPSGVNKTFRPSGSFINYKKSIITIYDRWGGKIVEISDISSGWDGKDARGIICEPGVYFYNLKIIGTNDSIQTKSGTVTLLD